MSDNVLCMCHFHYNFILNSDLQNKEGKIYNGILKFTKLCFVLNLLNDVM